MLRSLAGYIFGKGAEDEKPKPMDIETQEAEEWLVVNMPDNLVETDDLFQESSKSMGGDEILSAVPILMAQQNLDCDEPNAQILENFFSADNENTIAMSCINEFEDLATECTVLESPVLLPEPRMPNPIKQLPSKLPNDATMAENLADKKPKMHQENANRIKSADVKELTIVKRPSKTSRRRILKELKDAQQEVVKKDNKSAERKEFIASGEDVTTEARQKNLSKMTKTHRRRMAKMLEEDQQANVKKDKPAERKEFIPLGMDVTTEEKLANMRLWSDVVKGTLEGMEVQNIASCIEEPKGLSVNIQQEYVNAKKEKLAEEKKIKVVKRYNMMRDELRAVKIQKRKMAKKVKCLPANIQKENVNAKGENSTKANEAKIVKKADLLKDQLKLNAMLNSTCGSKNSKNSNHCSPVLHDLLQRIEQLKPQQKAKAHELNVEIVRGKLDRHNKNYIYETSAKTNRRKDRQRKSSGVNNNRKC